MPYFNSKTSGSSIVWSTTPISGEFDTSATTPTATARVNFGGYLYPTYLNLVGSADTATAATHYFVEQATDGFVRPKTLANVKTEIAGDRLALSGGTMSGAITFAAGQTWPTFNQSTTGNAATATKLNSPDTRAVVDTPQSFSAGVRFDFKANSTDGLDDGGTYHGVMTYRQHSSASDWSGGGVRQLGFTDNHSLWLRGANADTTWSTWKKILDSSNVGSYALPISGGTISKAATGPLDFLNVESTTGNAAFAIKGLDTSSYAYQTFYQGAAAKFEMGIAATTANFYINPNTQQGDMNASVSIVKATGNVLIGKTSDDGNKFQVNGSASVSGVKLSNVNSADATTLDWYEEASVTLNASGFTVNPSGTARLTRIGRVITIEFPSLGGTSNSTSFNIGTLPINFRPSSNMPVLTKALNNGNFTDCAVTIGNDGNITVALPVDGGGSPDHYLPTYWTASGVKSLLPFTATYQR